MAGTNPAAMRRYNPSRRGRTSVKQLPSVWFDHRTDLPDWVTIRIGRILVEWSVLERELEELIQLLINTDIAFSRIMTNRMNAQTRISTAYSLIEWYVYHGRLNASFLNDFERIGNRIKNDTQNKRDIVAHGLWSRINGDWEERNTRTETRIAKAVTRLSATKRSDHQKKARQNCPWNRYRRSRRLRFSQTVLPRPAARAI
jgi:hypothetical protein